MIKTSMEIENYIWQLSAHLGMEGEPKWVLLRFMLNISLSYKHKLVNEEIEQTTDGREYRLEQITGEGKGAEDYTKFYWDCIETYESNAINSKKELETYIQKHICRGYNILKVSLKYDSNIFDWLSQDFN